LIDNQDFGYKFFRSIDAAGKDWDVAAPLSDIFLQRDYLRILEENPPLGMRFVYLVFYKNNAPFGIAYCQIHLFKGDSNIQVLSAEENKEECLKVITNKVKKWVAGKVTADTLICGNMLLTGEHAYHFDYQHITPSNAVVLMDNAFHSVIAEFKKIGINMPAVLVKELSENQADQREKLLENGFVPFEIQPNMVMDLTWDSFDRYILAMSTKYRTRYKAAPKKLGTVEKRELTLEDMQRENDFMYAQYLEIANNAGFNMVQLHKNYMLALKRDFSAFFTIIGYFLEDKLIGYFTTIKNGDELEAHFIGFDQSLNKEYQIYQNMLYDIVKQGFDKSVHRVVFARTALEIKSTVGAVPENLYLYLRHQNKLANKLTGPVLDYLKPVETWVQRKPFKDND
jgi:Acetyltransferase (GNAT) domain